MGSCVRKAHTSPERKRLEPASGFHCRFRTASFEIQQNVVGTLGGHSGSQSGGLCLSVPSSQVRNLFGRWQDVSKGFGRLRLRPGDLLDHDTVVALDSTVAIAEGSKPESATGVCVTEGDVFPACRLSAELHLGGLNWPPLEAHGTSHGICRRPSACPFIVRLPRASDDSDGRKEESREGTNRRTARNPEAGRTIVHVECRPVDRRRPSPSAQIRVIRLHSFHNDLSMIRSGLDQGPIMGTVDSRLRIGFRVPPRRRTAKRQFRQGCTM